jgi:RNA polymerase sigma factor (sigma-70 family)
MHERELLKEFVEQGSQSAFAGLIERYSGLVYSTCLRELGDAELAKDVTQVVFLLSDKAASIRKGTGLSSWLFQTACFASKNALKQERRRREREQKAAEEMMREQQIAANEVGWNEISPHLNDALRHLKADERQAVLLRFFAGKSLQQVGIERGYRGTRYRCGRSARRQ